MDNDYETVNKNMNEHDMKTTHDDNIKEKKRLYMREYMRKYNLKHKGTPRVKLTKDEREKRLKESHKKYYLKNRTTILRKQQKKTMINRIKYLTEKVNTL